MKRSKNQASEKLLTEVELELMTILWRLGEGTVKEVMEGLPKQRALAYTSVSTILRILEQKKILQTRKEGRGHIYIPTLEKASYESATLKHVVERVFGNTPVALVRQLLGSVPMDAKEIEELKNLVEQLGKRK